jgi:microcystin-dependent protein
LDESAWDAGGKRITNVGLPVDATDAVTKQYIDGVTLYGDGFLGTPQAWSFTGTGSATTFILSPEALCTDPNFFIVEVGGVLQRPTTDYDVYGTYIQFASAPPNTVGIRVRNIGITRNVAAFNNPVVFNDGAEFSSTAIFDQGVTFNGTVSLGSGVTLPGATPIGGIIMWSGSIASIPSGWALCNGSSGTPDLRNKFIVGAGSTYAVAATGGSADAVVVNHTHAAGTLTAAAAGSHNHQFRGHDSTANDGGGATNLEFIDDWVESGWTRGTGDTSTVGNHTHSISGSVANPVGGVTGVNANLPPYYALAYIMRIA